MVTEDYGTAPLQFWVRNFMRYLDGVMGPVEINSAAVSEGGQYAKGHKPLERKMMTDLPVSSRAGAVEKIN